jgi:hypothetical protein
MKQLFPLLLFIILCNLGAVCQTDSLTTEQVVQDTVVEESADSKSYKRVSDFKVYGGVSASKILLSDSPYESAYAAGYILGFSYKKGRYGYWEIGINYNGSVVALDDVTILDQNMQIGQLELPLSAGINLLGTTRRVLGIRLFGGLVPGFITSIEDNPFGLVEDDFNRFQLGGRLGVGVDVLFLFVEGGYQYGFIDLLDEDNSNLSQLYFLLGFRF